MKEELGWIITEKEFSRNKKKFNDPLRMLYSDEGFAFKAKWECLSLLAKEVEEGDFIIMNNNRLFQVDYIEHEFTSSGAIKSVLSTPNLNPYDDDVKDVKDEDVEDGDTIFSFIYEDNGGVNGISLNNIVFDEKFMVIRIKKGTY